ncbi:BA75_03403T0 [Komagataella pastoris]|uniref:Nuclear distribution protein PAC1 n=1 Tax=Komagataella pastoris TaxID=4922 RepID=A0A1B2JF01_PICPA|nr:BA75_03403T0 [Komagataella pastoris]
MSDILTKKQDIELRRAVIQYLRYFVPEFAQDTAVNTISKLLLDADLNKFDNEIQRMIPKQYLEKKWTAVLRLHRKVEDLEREISHQSKRVEIGHQSQPHSDITTNSLDRINWVPSLEEPFKKLSMHNGHPVTAIDIHPFQPIMATASQDGTIVIWDLLNLTEPQQIIRNAHTRSINAIQFMNQEVVAGHNTKKNRLLLATGSSDLLIKIWDTEDPANLKVLRTLTGHENIISGLCFHPTESSKLVSCSKDKTTKVWDTRTGSIVQSFVGHSDWVRSVDINRTGEFTLTSSNDHSIRLSNLSTGTGIGIMIGHEQVVEKVKFLPMACNKYLDQFAMEKFQNEFNINDDNYNELEYKYCISGGRDSSICIWLLPLPLIRSDGTMHPSTNPQGKLLLKLTDHKSWVKDIAIHPNRRFIISVGDDRRINIWDLGLLLDTNLLPPFRSLSTQGFPTTICMAKPVIKDQESENSILLNDAMRCYLAVGYSDGTVTLWNKNIQRDYTTPYRNIKD